MKRKKIKLIPTHYTLEVFIIDSFAELPEVHKALHKSFGETVEYYEEMVRCSMVGIIGTDPCPVIVMVTLKDIGILAHEAVHVTWKLDQLTGFNIDEPSQEIQAYYVGYLVDKISKHF